MENRSSKNRIKRRMTLYVALIMLLSATTLTGIANSIVTQQELNISKERNEQLVNDKKDLNAEINDLRTIIDGYKKDLKDG